MRQLNRSATLLAGLLLVMVAWMLTTPPWAGPDEMAQYVKAVGLADGHLVGQPAAYPAASLAQNNAQQRLYLNSTTRSFAIPARLRPPFPVAPCFAFEPDQSAACQHPVGVGPQSKLSYVGLYQPLYFVVPGLFAVAGPNSVAGLRLARLGGMIVCLALLAVAFALSRSLAGLLLSLSPMVLSLTGTVTDSALEVVAAVAFTAACVNLFRARSTSRAASWAVLLTGIALAWSRPVGAFWVAATVVVVAVGLPLGELRQLLARRRVAFAALAIAAAGSVGWDVATGVTKGRGQHAFLLHTAKETLRALPTTFEQQVGVFSWLDTHMPTWSYVLWAVAVIGLVVAALLLGSWRERLSVVAGLACYLLAVFALTLTAEGSGFGTQGRYSLPMLILVVMVCGDILRGRRLVVRGAIAAFVVTELVGLWANGRRFAVGADGRRFFLTHASWSPPAGWIIWAVLALVGVALVSVSALTQVPGVERQS